MKSPCRDGRGWSATHAWARGFLRIRIAVADLSTLFVAHLKVLRNAAKVAGVDLDASTVFVKNVPTMRAGVTVPDCELNTEIAIYVAANG